MRIGATFLGLSSLLLVLLGTTAPETVQAQGKQPRAYYSSGKTINQWVKYKSGNYGMYMRFKAKPSDQTYKNSMVYYYPAKGKMYYYKNAQGKYWGRCPFTPSPKNPYQILNVSDQRESLTDIPEAKFIPLNQPRDIEMLVPVGGQLKTMRVRINPSQYGMPPLPGTAGTEDEYPIPPPPPPPEDGKNVVLAPDYDNPGSD